jgi:hypothetical protein
MDARPRRGADGSTTLLEDRTGDLWGVKTDRRKPEGVECNAPKTARLGDSGNRIPASRRATSRRGGFRLLWFRPRRFTSSAVAYDHGATVGPSAASRFNAVGGLHIKGAEMLALNDRQLRIVMDAARLVQPDRRDLFLQRCAAMLKLRGRFDDHDVAKV